MPTCDAAWLAAQRWYGAADRTGSARCGWSTPRRSVRGLSWQVVEVDFEAPAGQGDGADTAEAAHYQLFWDEVAGEDVAHHPAAIAWLFADLFGGHGPERADLLAGEQSNTSVVVEPGAGDRQGPAPAVGRSQPRRRGRAPSLGGRLPRRARAAGRASTSNRRRIADGPPRAAHRRQPPREARRGRARRSSRGAGPGTSTSPSLDGSWPGSTDGWRLRRRGRLRASRRQSGELGGLTAELHLALADVLGVHDVDGADHGGGDDRPRPPGAGRRRPDGRVRAAG